MLRLVGLWSQFQQAQVAVQRLGDVMDVPTEPYALLPQRAGGAEAKAGRIEFQGVAFRYSDKHPWLYRNRDMRMRGQAEVHCRDRTVRVIEKILTHLGISPLPPPIGPAWR